ncbi:MAG: S9 family peptidase [bacterium]|nr:S9 family peptidase [bacterium]
MRRSSLVLLLSLLFIAASAVAETTAFTVHDLVAMQRVSDPQPSSDGKVVAFTVSKPDLEANRGRTDIWFATIDGSDTRRLTTNPAGDWSPRWGDNGKLYFLSTRSGSAQVWSLSLAGGEAEQVTDLALGVQSLKVGPGAKALYIGLAVFPECGESLECTVKRIEAEKARRTTGRIYDQVFVRHWDTWKDGTRQHVFRVPLGSCGKGGNPVDLMAGVDGDSPTFPWGGDEDYTISPDDKWVVYTAKVVDGSEEVRSTDWDLWAVATDGSAQTRCLTEENEAWDTAPAFSPDGTRLAYLAMARPGFEADRYRVKVMEWPDGAPENLTEGWDRSPGGLTWSPDGKALFTTAANVGNQSIFRIDVDSGHVEALVTPHNNASPFPLPDGSLLFAQDNLKRPVELFVRSADGLKTTQVTDLNGKRLSTLRFGDYEQFSFIGAHGDEVFGYVVYPVDYERGKKYPLAFLVHGGPQGSFGDHWHYRWHPQTYACHGYATVMIDFHGSVGYGQDFTDAIRGDWGGAPYEDLMRGLDYALGRYKFIDGDRMAAAGASYGGYMINWIQGNTDRFKALVCHDGNLDEYMAYFDTEELWFPEWEHGGTPWENPEGYRKHSPVSLVQNWKTPELVIHGALDYRVVDTQGLATFNALQRLGVPSRLLYYPDENHWVLQPLNSIQWHEVVLDWMDQWTAVAE